MKIEDVKIEDLQHDVIITFGDIHDRGESKEDHLHIVVQNIHITIPDVGWNYELTVFPYASGTGVVHIVLQSATVTLV